jgi:hypothetical protein
MQWVWQWGHSCMPPRTPWMAILGSIGMLVLALPSRIPIPMLSYLTFSWIFAANLTCTNATNVLDFWSLCSHRKVRAFSPTASNLSIHHPARIWHFPQLQSHLFSSFESRRVSGFSLVTSHGVSIKSDMISGDLDSPTLFPVILSY